MTFFTDMPSNIVALLSFLVGTVALSATFEAESRNKLGIFAFSFLFYSNFIINLLIYFDIMNGFQGILLAVSGLIFVALRVIGTWISYQYGNKEDKLKIKKTNIKILKILLTGFMILVILAFIGEVFNL